MLKKPECIETVQSAGHSKCKAKSISSQKKNEFEIGSSIQNNFAMNETHKTNFFLSLYGKNKSEGCEVVTGTIDASQNTVCQMVLKGPIKKNRPETLPDHHNHDDNRLGPILQNLVVLGKCSEEIVKKENVFKLIILLLNDMANGESALLVIDDTQNILLPLMEQSRILSRMEAEREKLLKIIILGRMKRIQSLQSSQFKQTFKRITVGQNPDKLKVDEIRKNIENCFSMGDPKEGICFSTEALIFIRNNSLGISYMAGLMLENAHLSLHDKKATEVKDEIVENTVECLQFPKEQIDKKEEKLINKFEKGVKKDGFHKRADIYSRDKENFLERKDEIGIRLENSPTGKKIRDLRKIYLICFGILAIVIVVIVSLLNRKQIAKEDLVPVYTSTVPLSTENSVLTIQDISKNTRDDFDNKIKSKNHQQESVNALNNTVKYHNHNYQAATAILDTEGLDTKSGKPPTIH